VTRGCEDSEPTKLSVRVAALLAMAHGDPGRLVLFLDLRSEQQLEAEALTGVFGDWLKCQVVVRGVRRAFPRFAGFVVVWDHHEFAGKAIEELTLEEMRLVVKAQQAVIELLHENQRRV
jgi:hypothetical protein